MGTPMNCVDQMTDEVRLPMRLRDEKEQFLHDEGCNWQQCGSTQLRRSQETALCDMCV